MMTTRCKINVKDSYGVWYSIYRHADGYPEGVISDVKAFMESYHDPYGEAHGADYWLMNFAFYCKLKHFFLSSKNNFDHLKGWEYGYGICNQECKHGDLDYEYWIDLEKQRVIIVDYHRYNDEKTIFDGFLVEAFKKYASGNRFKYGGCHIDKRIIGKGLSDIIDVFMKVGDEDK